MPDISSLYKQIYTILDRHFLSRTDCGELCGKTCCCYTAPDDTESGMELFPGEEEVFRIEAGWHKPRFLPGTLYEYPPDWGERTGLFQIRCQEPCPRHERPVACRLSQFQDSTFY